MLRVITGSAKGRRLECPPGRVTRPPTDLLKGAVFNVLGASLEGARVLDLFCGCGAFGIEALSRGAASCVFAERSAEALAFLAKNLAQVGLSSRAEVRRQDAASAVRVLAGEGARFGLVFIDPPFAMLRDAKGREEVRGILEGALGLLEPGGTLVLRLPVRGAKEGGKDGEDLFPPAADTRKYGDSEVRFYAASGARQP